VCPVSWRTTYLYSDSGVSIVKPCRFTVCRFFWMRIWPFSEAQAKEMLPVLVLAFMGLTIRVRKSAG